MKKKEHKHYAGLSFLVSLVIFGIQFMTILIAGCVIYMLHKAGIVSFYADSGPGAGTLFAYMLIVSNIIGFFVIFITRNISVKPLARVVRQIDELASGNFKVRLHFNPVLSMVPVFARLSDSFNKMAEELENTEMLREDFVNNFSHEFKTPIVSIAGFASVLERGDLPREEQEQYLAVIREEAMRLSDMATNVLNLTKIENQTILTDVSLYNLSEQIRACILLLVDKWEKKGLEFKVDFREYMISGSEELLKQVWINLIDNAIKFSPEGEIIEINIHEEHDRLSVLIINTGEEISEKNQKRIFNKFYQADRSHSTEGNGIGLAIVRQVVQLHHGTVSVQSEKGLTMFCVTLPKRQ